MKKILLKKDLSYYQNLEYRIIVEPVIDEFGKEYIAYVEELGKYSCFGKGKTPQDAISSFLKEKDDFIEFLYNKGKPIPEPVLKADLACRRCNAMQSKKSNKSKSEES